MALKVVLCGLTLFLLGANAFSNNSYLITFPSKFRPGMSVKMNVLILKSKPMDASVTVNATFLINSKRITSATGEFFAGQTGSLLLQIPREGYPENVDEYHTRKQLEVVGSGGLTFNITTERNAITFDKKGFTIYVQTDKGIYKPGQIVHMRILAVYPCLKVHTGKMTITITDPKNNKLALWKDQDTMSGHSGVVSKDFELSSQPNIGKWKILVEIEGQTKETEFDVKEYVLPKFEVKVLANSYATKGNGEIRGTVTAKYTYGKNVEGSGKLFAHFPCVDGGQYQCEKYELNFEVDGSHSFVISKERVTGLYTWSDPYQSNYGYQFVLNASVTEKLTKKTYYGETTVKLHRSAIALEYADSSPETFKAGFPFEALIEVTRPDGSPVHNKLVSVTSTTWPGEEKVSTTYTSDKDGYFIFKRSLGEKVTSLNIDAKAKDEFGEEVTMYKRVSKFRTESGTYLAVSAVEYEVEVGSEIVCNVKSTENFSSLSYILLSRGNTLQSETAIQNPPVKATTFKFTATSIMSPSAKILVYIVRDDGEIIADSLTVKVNGAFENEVSVEFNTTQTKPGEAVGVNVEASPHSHVGLLAVDKSVLLLDQGNDFSVSQVMEELGSYGGDSSDSFPPWWRWRRRRSFFPWYPSAQNSLQIFKGVDLAMITDCKIFDRNHGHNSWQFLEVMEDGGGAGGRPMFKTANNQNGPQLAEVTTVRTLFPETWLWETIKTDSSGHAHVGSKSPDTITSWVLSGYAVSNATGFGVANEKPQLRVFQPFFLSMDLPYSVIRGEQVAIKVIVFNYENEEKEVTVTLKSSEDWKNLVETNDNSFDNTAGDVDHVVKVSANSGAAISFPIIPSKLGNIPIEVHARTTTSADGVRRTLLVEPEGVEQEYSYSLLMDLNSTASTFKRELELALPSNVVEGSPRATISVIGDIMGSSISGMEKLLKMPYGCGEQNMINFAPSMFIRAYLETVDQLTQSIKDKSIKFMTSGYQRELSYQHSAGSYSAFGEREGVKRTGSLWLTAFVVKSFSRARSYIYIDPDSLSKSTRFILGTQKKDGSFAETGHVSSYLQGGLKSSAPEALTAYVLVSLLESGDDGDDTKIGISRAVQFLKGKLKDMSDTYTLALVAYAFELADDPAKETVLGELLKNAIREDGTLHWEEKRPEKTESNSWFRPYYRPRSADIEITSYVLLMYAHRKDTRNGLPVAQWLAQQRNSLGGYSSTQDTVIGLQALSEFAPLVFSSDVTFTVNVRLSADASYSKTFQVNEHNLVVLQEEELPTVDGRVLVSAQGKGIAVLQIGVTYNVKTPPTDNSFDVHVKVETAGNNEIEAQSCVKYSGDGSKSGMAILEFGLPSGFSLDQDDVDKLLLDEDNKIQRIERPGRKAVLYFDEIPKSNELCVKIKSVRTHAVGKAQPIPVVVYDYYKPEKRATTMYSTQDDVDICEVCENCANCKPRRTGDASHVVSLSHVFMLIFTVFLYHIY